ncbi:MAG TPA: efflux RND transporter periplasmic adaptor subunit [Candidatus Sulfotelmatobacter sp.]|nr:efflux RND transporter periplasmic adaptor subunit [Candidatus Sulfotelmatobacter sp.]
MHLTVAPAQPGLSPLPPPPPPRSRRRPLLLWAGLALLLALAALALVLRLRGGRAVGYFTAPVTRGSLVQTVTAEGTVNPQNLILVGTQVSGTIAELDVDYNSQVRAGQVMAKIDPTTFRDAYDQASAAQTQSQRQFAAGVATAQSARQTFVAAGRNAAADRAALASAVAQVGKAKAALDFANLTVRRDRALLARGYIAQNQTDADVSAAVAAQAAYAAARLAVEQARAQLAAQEATAAAGDAQARSADASASAAAAAVDVERAQVAQADYNVRQSVITSPVNGTVIARNISIGQTVAASFQTPTLFSIAQDLSKMEVDIAVGEPDVGGIRAGAIADFTVLAYPNRTFHGVVYQVRQNPTTVNNVVTYDTVVYVDNRDGALYPGMTANATIHVASVTGALIVPLEALQWAPPAGGTQHPSTASTSPWGTTMASVTRTVVAGRTGRVFVLRAGQPQLVPVRIVLVSETQAAVTPLRGALNAGDPLIVADASERAASATPAPASALTRTSSSLTSAGARR